MWKFISGIIGFFSPYANNFEKKIDKFLGRLNSRKSKSAIHAEVLILMQENLIALQLWLERRYKAYKYLDKKTRKKLNGNFEVVREDFLSFAQNSKIDIGLVHKMFQQSGINTAKTRGFEAEFVYLAKIMAYVKPNHFFTYRAASNFGALLNTTPKDSNSPAKMNFGDCNQLVTLYCALFALNFDLRFLQIKQPPEHVCLHLNGVDIEATSGCFTSYQEKSVSPVSELVAVNLLDVKDKLTESRELLPQARLEAAKMAYLLSSHREIVQGNLRSAYINSVNFLLEKGSAEQAAKTAEESNMEDVKTYALKRCVSFYLSHKKFAKALQIANKLRDFNLAEQVKRAEAVEFYQQKNFEKALYIFEQIRDRDAIKACFNAMAIELANEISKAQTLDEMKKLHQKLNLLKKYASKGDSPQLVEYANSLLRQIQS
jgi:hypothetical protein